MGNYVNQIFQERIRVNNLILELAREVNNQIPEFRELVMGTSFFSVQDMCLYNVLYRLYRIIHKLI